MGRNGNLKRGPAWGQNRGEGIQYKLLGLQHATNTANKTRNKRKINQPWDVSNQKPR